MYGLVQVSSRATLEKYGISFLYDVEAYLKTLDMVEHMKGTMFIPAHAETTKDIGELVRYHRDKVWKIAGRMIDLCRKPMNFEKILQAIFREYGLVMNFEPYVLVGSTIRSYLSWLKERGTLSAVFVDNLLVWQSKEGEITEEKKREVS